MGLLLRRLNATCSVIVCTISPNVSAACVVVTMIAETRAQHLSHEPVNNMRVHKCVYIYVYIYVFARSSMRVGFYMAVFHRSPPLNTRGDMRL